MKSPATIRPGARLVAVIGLTVCAVMGCKKAAPPGGPAKPAPAAKTNSVGAATSGVDLAYVSVFEDLPWPKGKDPFFPDSHRREPAAAVVVQRRASQASSSELVLKAIVRSARTRQVIINNEILASGEEGSVQVPHGHLHVTCIEIGDDYAIVKVEGEAELKRLDMGQKK